MVQQQKCCGIHLNGISDRKQGRDADLTEAINTSNEYLSLISVTHSSWFKNCLKKYYTVS